MKNRRTAVVICPGRGTYNRGELGYLRRWHADAAGFLKIVDNERARRGQALVSALDGAEEFDADTLGRGDNASALIYACSFADYVKIDPEIFKIVAVTGNSMGWYTALACGGAIDAASGANVVNTMGLYVHEGAIGAQVVYPLVDEAWRDIPGRRQLLVSLAANLRAEGETVHLSIDLGGMLLFAGSDSSIAAFEAEAPKGPGRFPMRLRNHGAFHSPLMTPVSQRAREIFGPAFFGQPTVPLIDGRGRIWRPQASDAAALCEYTFGTQVVEPYDFAAAVRTAMCEFAPDIAVVLGPGETLGSAVAQSLIAIRWQGIASKTAFVARQASDPFVLCLGRADQRAIAMSSARQSVGS